MFERLLKACECLLAIIGTRSVVYSAFTHLSDPASLTDTSERRPARAARPPYRGGRSGNKEGPSFLVALPCCRDDARLLGPAAVVDELLDAVVFTDVEFPRVAGRANRLRGILHRDQLAQKPLPSGGFCMPRSVTVALRSQ